MKRFFRWTAIGLVSLVALIVLAENVVLNCGLVPNLANEDRDKLELGWSSAWSLWPGVVHMRGFRLRIQDRNVQIQIKITSAVFAVDPSALLRREIHGLWVKSEGGSFRMRLRPKSAEEEAMHKSLVPPIDGLTFEALAADEAKEKTQQQEKRQEKARDKKESFTQKKQDEEKRQERAIQERKEEDAAQDLLDASPAVQKLLRIHVENVDAELTDYWFEDWHWQGQGRVTGGFFLRPKLTLQVGPATAKLEHGTLSVGEMVVSKDLRLDLAGTIFKMNPEDHKGIDFLDFVQAKVGADAEVESLAFINDYLLAAPWLKVRQGQGDVHASVEFNRGSFLEGGLEANSSRLEADVLDDRVTGEAKVTGSVVPGANIADPVVSTLEIEFGKYEARRKGTDTPHMRGKGLKVTARSLDLSIFDPGARLSVNVLLPRAEVPDLSFYNRYIPPSAGIAVDAGVGWIEGHLAWDSKEDHGSGALVLGGEGVGAHFEDLSLKGTVRLDTRIADARLGQQTIDVGGTTLSLKDVALSGPTAPPHHSQDWWAEVKLPEAHITPGHSTFFDAVVDAQLQDSAPIVAIFLAKKKLPELADIGVRSLLDVSDVHVGARLAVGEGRLDLTDLQVDGQGLELKARLKVKDKDKQGVAFVKRGPFEAGLRIGEKVHVELINARDWYGKQPDP